MKITKVKDEYIITLEIRVSSLSQPAVDNLDPLFPMQDPKGPDGGAYKCVIKNKKGEISANLNLKLEDAGDEGAPTFVEKPRSCPWTVERGIDGVPGESQAKPDVSWTCEGQDIKPSPESSKQSRKTSLPESTISP
ncbi:unc-22 [Cordylochernes scorpioides]|uniref:Unc-22 n=1 Tax=Cordylochernes scorpioides TaxID=51811 RepID=A0ABY6LGS7_9ARAC|nr:unc-22 [Cordylochernes scorpioides]